ncbi:MAG: hypothetical protein ACI9VX_001554 [Dinoroseobacter sp.]|jgi:hypothetical protein
MLKRHPDAEISVEAHRLRERGEFSDLRIEHAMPRRALTRLVIDRVNSGASDEALIEFMTETYRLVVLTKSEMQEVDRVNRSEATQDRIAEAGVKLWSEPQGGISGP